MAKVLIIEDDPVMQKMYQRVFGFEGFEVDQAIDGQQGLEKAKTVAPDMILLDIMMPVMSGMQVLDALKADPATEQIPVMVFTNLAGKQDADGVLARGAIACIHKSQVNPKQVVQMVRDELNNRGIVVQNPDQGDMMVGQQSSAQSAPVDQAVSVASDQTQVGQVQQQTPVQSTVAAGENPSTNQ